MKYKCCLNLGSSAAIVASVTVLLGCVLATASPASAAAAAAPQQSTDNDGPKPLTVKPQSCCQDDDVLSTNHHECFNHSGNFSYRVQMNCSLYYIIYQELEAEVHIDAKGNLVEENNEIEKWENYCFGTLLDGTDSQPVLMVCFNPEDQPNLSAFLSKGIMMLVSVFFLAMTLYIYFIIPDLRETQDKVTSIAVACLMVFMILMSTVQLAASITFHPVMCMTIAFLMYFFMISYFAWLNTVMANVWKLTVARRWKIRERHWYVLNHIYAHTVALTLTAMVYIYHMRNPTFGEISCWFRTEREQSYFVYLPLSIMLSINIFLFVWTSYHLHASGDDISPDRKKALRYKCMLYLKLFLLAGLIWIFEIISFHVEDGRLNRSWFWFLIDSINCLHGVLIFFVLIVWRQRIKRELSGRRVLCFRAPAHWAQLKDDEQEQLADEAGRDYGKYDLIIK
ncbi:probable G-protein coupled receptor Mth-like 1 [Ochlerotatus camptorhynchus]|uniref:probable G-protein coupled receptor Mth-like 1 n=1 Tax=Ochlerotatus camptorhynchus TaxID=644619 RepID=UPI0031D7061C